MRNSNERGLTVLSLVFLLLFAGASAAVWFEFLRPFFLEQQIIHANQKFEFNLFSEAKLLYEQLLPKTGAQEKRALQDHLSQLSLAEKRVMDLAPPHPTIALDVLEAISAKVGLLFIHYAIQNNGRESIPIRRSLFYLKSQTGKSEVALDRPQNKEVNSWDGDLLPGERVEGGICVKYFLVDPDEKIYLVYNNGSTYINSLLPISLIWPQTSKDIFHEGWLGRKIAAVPMKEFKRPAVSENPPSAEKPATPPTTQPATPPISSPPPSTISNPQTYKDETYGFTLTLPAGWKKINRMDLSSQSPALMLPSVSCFKSPSSQEKGPFLLIQKGDKPYGKNPQIDNTVLTHVEQEIRTALRTKKVEIKQVTSRISLLKNTQVAEVDLLFTLRDDLAAGHELFHLKSYCLEGNTEFIISLLATHVNFNACAAETLSAILSFESQK
ncbi:MAG: DUF4352 domain-containing protein [Chlamydiae bacterium]|nr:DUF4352 domain-containing protein [Chlamydiota bacterium]